MKRIALTDETGAWFDADKAWDWGEGEVWDGRNQISLATGSHFCHERLYRTPGGRYIIKKWCAGVIDDYELVDAASAAAWMIRNKVDIEKPKIHELESEIAKLEIK